MHATAEIEEIPPGPRPALTSTMDRASWVDARGRRRRPLPQGARHLMPLRAVVNSMIAAIRELGCDGEDMTPDDVLEFYEAHCADIGAEQETPARVLEALGEAEGVVTARERLGAPKHNFLRRRLTSIAKLRGEQPKTRSVLYRILTEDQMAAAFRQAMGGSVARSSLGASAAHQQPRVPARRQLEMFGEAASADASCRRRAESIERASEARNIKRAA